MLLPVFFFMVIQNIFYPAILSYDMVQFWGSTPAGPRKNGERSNALFLIKLFFLFAGSFNVE